jgi:hypothetical protein
MICRIEGGAPIEQEMRKLEVLKVREVQREEEKKTRVSRVGKLFFFSSFYFFITPFLFHFKDDF